MAADSGSEVSGPEATTTVPSVGNLGDFLPTQFDQRMRLDFFSEISGKAVTVDRQGAAGGNGGGIGGGHEKAAATAQLLLQQADRILHAGAAQAVGADQFAEQRGVMRR